MLLFTAMTFAVFLPLYSGEYTLRGEAADLLMPVFSHMREALLQGEWPLWNKYQNQGIATSMLPLYWNPVILFLACVFPSPDLEMSAWYLIHIFIAGLGFYKFSGPFLNDPRTKTLAGLCYPLTGFFVVQSQDIGLIVAAAWVPLLLYETIRYQNTGESHHLTFLAIGYFLFMTGTSMGFVLMVTGLIGILALYSVLSKKQPIARSVYPFTTIIITGFLVWKIYWERWQSYVDAPEYESSKTGAFQSFHDLSSLVLSRTTGTPAWLMGQEGPVQFHLYIGIIILILALLTFWYSKKRMDRKLGYGCLVLLLLAVISPAFENSPLTFSGMSGSAFSAGIKTLLAICLLVSGLRGLENFSFDPKKARILFPVLSLIFAGFALFTMNTSPIRADAGLTLWFIQTDLWKSALFLFLAGIFFWVRRPTIRLMLLSGLILAETGLSAYLNQDSNLYNEYPSSLFSDKISHPELKSGTIHLTDPVGRYTDKDLQIASLDRNTGTLFRQIVRDGYWPWMTRLHEKNEHSVNRNEQLRYPLFYFSRDTSAQAIPSYTNFNDSIAVLSESGHAWGLSILNGYEKYLVFNQNYDRNWRAAIDGEWIPVSPTSAGMMKIPIPPGLHKVVFQYRTDGLLHIFIVSMIVLTILMLLLVIKRIFPFFILIVGVPVIAIYLMATARHPSGLPAVIPPGTDIDSADFTMNYEGKAPFWFTRPDQITTEDSYDGYRSEAFNQKAEYSAMLQIHRNALKGKKELEYKFYLKSSKPIETAVVLKTYNLEEDSYNIQYITSLNSDKWEAIEGRFSLEGLPGPLVKLDFYIWNHEKQNFLIDDIQVKLNP